jgi:putative tricarboxylic transport membrane protein
MAVGLMLSTVGQEMVTGADRFTFGVRDLTLGVELVALVVGLYGVTEIMSVVESLQKQGKPIPVKLKEMFPSREEWRRSWGPYGRGTAMGFVLGLLPGPSATMASFASYRLEKGVSKYKEQLGEGAIEGVAGPETANNAAATSSMVPLLALGIPFGSVTALMLAAMMVHGVQPGPMMMTSHPEIFWGVIASMLIGNAMLVVLNIPLIGLWVSLLRVPNHVFLPIILIVATIGCYSVRNSMVDVYMLWAIAMIGYALRKLEFQLAPLVVGVVLGPLIEKHLREGLFMSLGDVSVFYTSPIAIGIWSVVVIVLLLEPLRSLYGKLFGVKVKKLIPESSE